MLIPRLLLLTLGFATAAHNYVESRRLLDPLMVKERRDHGLDTQAYNWIARHAAPDTVLLAWRDSLGFLYTGMPSSRSHMLGFVEIDPSLKDFRSPLSQLPPQYRQALILLSESDLGAADPGPVFRDLRSRVEAIAGTRLEYETRGAAVYAINFR